MRIILVLCLLGGPALAECPDSGGNPEWSPNGESILFVSEGDVWRMKADGSEPRNLTPQTSEERHPAWLPDGDFLFDSDRSGQFEIYRYREGREPEPLTRNPALDLVGRPSADGANLVFNSMRSGTWGLYLKPLDRPGVVVRLEDSPATEILREGLLEDGSLVFDSDRDTGDGRRQIYRLRPGGAVERLTDDPHDNRFARRGPPGTHRIVFTSNRGGDRGLWLIPIDGGEPAVLVDWAGDEAFASWHPTAQSFVFESTVDGSRQLYRIDRDGETAKLTGQCAGSQ